MAHVLALIPDLMFGSRVQSMMAQAGHEIELVTARERAEERLACADVLTDVLIVDLTDERLSGPELVEAISSSAAEGASSVDSGAGRAEGDVKLWTLGFYSHVDVETRKRALSAGFDLVVPRSRMAREGAELVSGLVARA